MGGKDSGVSSSSSTLWLEAAYFNPSATRKTAFQHNIHSDSSYRFERGADPAQVLQAQALATALLIEFAGATPTQIIQANRQIDTIHLAELNHAQALTTLNIPDTTTADLHRILTHLNLVLKNQDALTSLWEIPSYRADLRRHADLVEEIARIYGLDAVAPSFISTYSPTSSADAIYDEQLRLRQQLAHLGLFESQNLRFVANDALNFSIEHDQPTDKAVPLKNPLSTDYAYLRPNLIAGLLANAEANVRQGTHQLRFFELGTVFETFKAGYMGNDRLSLLLSGANQTQTWQNNKPNNTSIHDLHGILCQSLRISELEWHPLPHTPFFIQRFQLKYQNKAIGWAGQIHPSQARSRDIKNPIFVAEIRYTPLQQALATPPIKYTELPKFPSVSRDVAFELPQSLTYREVRSFFTKYKEPLLVHTELFDLYTDPTGEKLALDKKSMAWQLTYRSLEKTLDSAEVDAAHQKLLTQLKATLNITIR
jgi:phenylalanyl-tRNA synthetase beta chain